MYKNKKRISVLFISFIVVIIGSWTWGQFKDVQGPGIPVLLYHGVDSNGPKDKYTIDTEAFERQLRWLRDNGYSTILPRDIKGRSWDENPKKTVMLTFDDGRADNFRIVMPLLQKYGFRGVFFIVTGALGEKGIVTIQQVKDMSIKGMEIGSHTVTHPFLDTLDAEQITYQLQQSKKVAFKDHRGERICSGSPRWLV